MFGFVRQKRRDERFVRSAMQQLGAGSRSPTKVDVERVLSDDNAKVLLTLYEYVLRGDSLLSSVAARHGATLATLQEIYESLEYAGAGQWVDNAYVPVEALTQAEALDFVLNHAPSSGEGWADTWESIAFAVIEFCRTRDPRALVLPEGVP
jgi:hypothetical protein